MQTHRILQLLPLLLLNFLISCDSSDIKDSIELAEGVPRETINADMLGTNSFLNDNRFGSIDSQLSDVKNNLRLNFVRILFAWTDSVQPSPSASPNYSFYDSIAGSIPPGMDAIVVLTNVPSWMKDSANWIDGNPRKTFAQQWVGKTARRYAGNGRIIGWEIWNEQNMLSNPDNTTLGIATSPANYTEMLTFAFNEVRAAAPGKLVLSGPTTAINQNFPETLDYNKGMQEAGALNVCDIWAVHYYGKQFEKLITDGGVADFLNSFSKEVWVTESGERGVNSQLDYGEHVWHYLKEQVPSIQRIYQYQYTEASGADSTYGLRNLTPGRELSDLYVYLRDR